MQLRPIGTLIDDTALNAHIADTDIHFSDAPADAQDYVRNNNVWVVSTGGGVTDHTLLTNIGVNSHAVIDAALTVLAAHILDTDIHFSDAPADAQDYVRNNNAWAVASPGGVTDHTLLTNIGTTSHADIDTQLTALALRVKAITVENPTGSSEIFSWFFTDVEITVQQLNYVVTGIPAAQLDVSVQYGPARNAVGTELTTGGETITNMVGGQEVTSFDSAVIPANSWITFRSSSPINAPDEIHISMIYN